MERGVLASGPHEGGPMPASPAPAGPTTAEAEPVSLHQAYRVCEDIARTHYENFPIASRFLPADRRIALAAIYAFARQADDVADARAPSADRLRALDAIEGAFLRSLDGEPRGPVLALHGIEGPEPIRASDAVCTALQLTNFWQDLGADLGRGRLFLPLEDLELFGLNAHDLTKPSSRPALTKLLAHEVRATRDLFERGTPILELTP